MYLEPSRQRCFNIRLDPDDAGPHSHAFELHYEKENFSNSRGLTMLVHFKIPLVAVWIMD